MTNANTASPNTTAPFGGHSALALISVFTLSIFLSAVLLFSVQPMFTKLVLPLLGGASNVWNTAMVFFQGVLLLGYIYAHVISKYLSLRTQIICHLCVLGVGCFFLPLSIVQGWTPPEGGAQSLSLIALFAMSVGAPFFAISANAPLLQRWFSRVDHKDAQDPYFLYAASNVGSLLSLCLYPVLFEPNLRVQEQTGLWAIGYFLLMAVILAAGHMGSKSPAPVQALTDASGAHMDDAEKQTSTPRGVTLNRRLFWIFLAFIPSSLMLGVTSHMTSNVASTPFLWVMPLALYLLTFVFAFAKNPIVKSHHLRYVGALAIFTAVFFSVFAKSQHVLSIGASLAAYFIISLACHSRLVEDRPTVSHLTEFYIWMSVGGVLGGIFNALLAPVVFNNVYEYLLILGVAYLAVMSVGKTVLSPLEFLKKFWVFGAICAALLIILPLVGVSTTLSMAAAGSVFFIGLRYITNARPLNLIIDLALVFGLAYIFPILSKPELLIDRSFFGVLKVKASEGENGTVHKFVHGDTVHNYQLRDDGLRTTPLAYYASGNSFDKGMQFARTQTTSGDMSVAMIGLGAGAMACYEREGDDWTYYEIDQAVVDMAKDPKYFSYMQDCSFKSNTVTGDARLKIQALPERSQDYIVVDAFSSDSIPAHLVTREALALYRSKLKDGGVIFFHTTNRVLDIDSLVVRLADDAGLASRRFLKDDFGNAPYQDYQTTSSAVMVGTQAQMQALSTFNPDWAEFTPSPLVKVWSDDYSNILATLRAKHTAEKASEGGH